MDVVLLARLQFALTIMFHYLFPPLTIGMSVVIVYLIGMHLRTKEAIYDVAARFWTRLFALNFAMGVVSGIVMEFQFGTNWAVYSRYVGDVFGSALAAEGIFAFFLESGFLAVLVFGWDRVSPRMHFVAAFLVALGGIFSSIWITVANSWQQTPAGFTLRPHEVNGQIFHRAEITDFVAMVFNPSTLDRLVHVWIGAFILGALFVTSISAWYLLHGRHVDFARRSFVGGLLFGTIFSLAQLLSGHSNASMVAEHQPAKLAAMEGLYRSEKGAALYLFGWPDEEAGRVAWGLPIPGALSLLVHGDVDAEVKGFDQLEERYGRPPVWLTFQAYHLMVGCGLFFIVLTLVASFFHWRGTLFEQRWLLWIFVPAVILGFLANELGWVVAEVGRQPWIVYPSVQDDVFVPGLRTADAVSESVVAGQVLASILGFGAIYALLFVLWIYLLNHKIQQGPEPVHPPSATTLASYLETASHRTGHEESFTESKAGG